MTLFLGSWVAVAGLLITLLGSIIEEADGGWAVSTVGLCVLVAGVAVAVL